MKLSKAKEARRIWANEWGSPNYKRYKLRNRRRRRRQRKENRLRWWFRQTWNPDLSLPF